MAYITSDRYKEVIYSQDCRHKLKIWFNDVELENADIYCEKLTVSSRIIPNGSKVFMLENFISKEATLILHEVDLSVIKDQVKISIGTLVDNEYEYVPIGIFNIQDKPTTDNGKTTIKLRDNSVKFDFNYNGKELIDNNGGSATKLQILQDICNQAGVVCNITEFLGSEDLIGIYDNTITGRTYVSYLAGQSGAIPTINRDGELIFVYINNLVVHEIPLHFVEKYSDGDLFKISRVVYESGIIKYESGTTDNDTLFLDSSNPYLGTQSQIDNILEIVNGFEINSFSTGKIIGNPAIDSYDLISITDGDNTYITLATNELVYNGVIIQTFDTEIGLEERKENVSLNGENTFKKWAKTEIDRVDARITSEAGRIDTIEISNTEAIKEIQNKFDGYTPLNQTLELEKSVTQIQTDTYSKIQIDTKLKDGSVTMLKSTTLTADDEGLTVDKNDSKTKSNLDADGLEIIDKTGASQEVLLEARYDENLGETIVRSKNMRVEKYLNIGTHSRIEDYENGTGVFWIG